MDNQEKDQFWTNTKTEFLAGVRTVNLFVYQIVKNVAMLPYHIVMNTPLPGDPVKKERTPSDKAWVNVLWSVWDGVIEGLGYVFRSAYLACLIYVVLTLIVQVNYHMTLSEFWHHLFYTTANQGGSL